LAWLYAHGEVLSREDGEEMVDVVVRLLPADRARFEREGAVS
jgi:GTP-binding protein HflX